jgi:HAD superfamily hydrolase (TIGR01484 family)
MPPNDASLLLCSDLDGTLIPDGRAPESPDARPLFRRLAAHRGVCLAYVTGRHPELAEQGLQQANLPQPQFLLGDVGSSIYLHRQDRWEPLQDYWTHIGPDWDGAENADLQALLADMPGLRAQEPERQGKFKASWYAAPGTDAAAIIAVVRARLADEGVRANVIWSQDVDRHTGLLDILPARADKRQAILFLHTWLDAAPDHTVFAGDSGNDLAVLGSDIPSTLVANAAPKVREAALGTARAAGCQDRLYLAQGGYRGMNGNYAAGVLEGVVHFVPEVDAWLDQEDAT